MRLNSEVLTFLYVLRTRYHDDITIENNKQLVQDTWLYMTVS